MVIEFYSVTGEFGCFSNFSKHPIKIGGKVWKTTEHYFQAQKFCGTDDAHYAKIRKATKPSEAAALGRDRSKKIRKDWESVKISIMRSALRAKFSQHADIKEVLLSTGSAKIVEHTGNDSFWADGGDGTGQNWLGRLLMEIRDEYLK